MCRVTATLGCEILVRDVEHTSEAVRIVKRRVIEAVFGEFRPLIREL